MNRPHWLREFFPTCRDALRLHSRALDASLPWRIRLGLHAHLMCCSWCRRFTAQVRSLHDVLREEGGRVATGLAEALTPEMREQIKDSLRRELTRAE